MKTIAILYGGPSAEREVSLSSGKAVAKAIDALGHRGVLIDAGDDLVERLRETKPDVVFNALHGRWGEDGCVQGILEWLHIPYTHSGVLASAVAMHKPKAKEVFAAAGIRCAEGKIITDINDAFEPPFVLKPLNEGSSVGVTIVHTSADMPASLPSKEVLIERYVPGREIQVAVLDDAALGAIEIVPKSGFYDYEAKYTDGKAQHLMPAPLEKAQYEEVCELALRAHVALGCRGLTRSDFRLSEAGDFYILETNTQPGMTPLSLAPEIAAHGGMSFAQLVARLIDGACLDG
tara:strand:+ start:256 stop:1128 length:873 start_codon:yes stop_codon:yes gene_type:complete